MCNYYDIAMRTTEVSSVSVSTKTSSPVSENFGTAINLTVSPSGPSIIAVSNFGCDPTKNK
jgi:hypothetical protein